MAGRKYSDNQREHAAILRERGFTYGQIARRTGMSEGSVYWHCLRLGADHPNPRATQQVGPALMRRGNHVVRRYSAEEDALILEMEASGHSVAEIARRLDRRHNSVSTRLMTLGRIEARAEAGI
ncbi:hypothetical protein ACEUZ9_001132 [Paracoccus litorisediminis]|uniref:hypothetical protein n=1 Tax=Paracoccus litorisediminis TaxID=2006130 RepID=UPI0037346328